MTKEFLEKRTISLDLIRCIACCSVISVHFFMYIGFYDVPVSDALMYFMTILRCAFMIGVPLFILLTGSLMNKKTLNLKYYKAIVKTLGIYVLCSIVCLLFKRFYIGDDVSLRNAISGILTFSAASYGWYINMYIGLFLVIPFLNLIYNGLDTKRKKQVLLLTFFTLSTLPTLTNWHFRIIPDWWINIYPISYYFMGAYISEFDIKIKKRYNLLLIIAVILANGLFNIWQNFDKGFVQGMYGERFGVQNAVLAVLVFILIKHLNLKNLPVVLKRGIVWFSRLSLGAYLVSMVFDQIIYPKLNELVPIVQNRILYFPLAVPIVIVLSLAVSLVINKVYDLFEFLLRKVVKTW